MKPVTEKCAISSKANMVGVVKNASIASCIYYPIYEITFKEAYEMQHFESTMEFLKRYLKVHHVQYPSDNPKYHIGKTFKASRNR